MWQNPMLMNSNEYLHIVESIKREIRTAQYRAGGQRQSGTVGSLSLHRRGHQRSQDVGQQIRGESCRRHQAFLSGRHRLLSKT